jgi:hypothetical protein
VEPLLILDAYRCHKMKSIVNKIEELGARVHHIHGGCTSVCQPVNVGIRKPLKHRLRNKHSMWKSEQVGGTISVRLTPSPRSDVASTMNVVDPYTQLLDFVDQRCFPSCDIGKHPLQQVLLQHKVSRFDQSKCS